MVSMHTENTTRYNRVVFVTKITRLQMKIVILTVIEDDVVLLEVGEFSDDDESDSQNKEILLPLNSRTGRPCTTCTTQHFYGDSE